MRLGWPEIVLILVVVLIIFGAGKLPQIGAQLGKGLKEFRRATKMESGQTSVEGGEDKTADPKNER